MTIDKEKAVEIIKRGVKDQDEMRQVIEALDELPGIREYTKQVKSVINDFNECRYITTGCENCRAAVKIGNTGLTVCDILIEYGNSIYNKMTDVLKA